MSETGATDKRPMELLLSACQTALSVIEAGYIDPHSKEDVGIARGRLNYAILLGRQTLLPGRRYIAKPHQHGHGWEVVDTRASQGSRPISTEITSTQAILLEEDLNADDKCR